jgi:hypothetical protein
MEKSSQFPYNKPDLSTALQLANNVPIDQLYNDQIDMSQYVGWETISSWNGLVRRLFTKRTLAIIRQKVSEYLTGISREGKKIIPSDRVIIEALWGVFQNYQPEQMGDMYGRYLVVNPNRDDYSAVVDLTISLLYRGIKTDIEMTQANEKLNIWDATILGDFNPLGLRQHSVIYTRERRPDPFLFNMNY